MNKPREELQKIFDAARGGDAQAFSEIYEHYYTPVYRYVYLRTRDKELSEDILQETFLKAYRSLSSFVFGRTDPLAYFFTIARNTLIDHSRKKRPTRISSELAENQPDFRTPESEARTQEDVKELKRLLDMLGEEQREAIVLRFISGHSNKEIAILMDRSEAAVRQLQSRGMRALREFTRQKK